MLITTNVTNVTQRGEGGGGVRRCRDRMVVEFTTTCAISVYHTKVMSSNPVHGDMYSIQHYVIKFVSVLRQVGDVLQVHRWPPPIKLTTTI